MKHRTKPASFKHRTRGILLFSLGFAVVGSIILFAVQAGTSDSSIEPESGAVVSPASTLDDVTASSGKAVQFNAPATGGSSGFCDTYPALPSSKPDATNTGVPSGTSLTAYTGSMTITAAGTVIDGKIITGSLVINANNVTIKNSRIHATGYYGVTSDGPTNTKIINSELYAQSGDTQYVGLNASNTFFCGNYVHGFENGITIGANNIIQANFIEKLGSPEASPHYDGIEVYSGNNSQIWGNNILMTDKNGNWLSDTGAINVTATWSNISGVVIHGNWMGGGGNTLNLDEQGGYKLSNLTVTNNRWYGSAPKGYAFWGPIRAQNLITTFTGNVWDATNQAL